MSRRAADEKGTPRLDRDAPFFIFCLPARLRLRSDALRASIYIVWRFCAPANSSGFP